MTIHPWPKPEPKVKPPKVKKPRKPLVRKARFLAGGNGERPGKGMKRGRIKGKPRPKNETERIYGPKAFRDWLHRQPCAVCGWRGHVEQAHAKTGGIGRKDDWTRTLPLCSDHLDGRDADGFPCGEMRNGCHRESGRGVKSFEKKYGVSLLALAAKTQTAWESSRASLEGK